MKHVLVGFWDVGLVGGAFTFTLPEELVTDISETDLIGRMVIAPVGKIKRRGIILGFPKENLSVTGLVEVTELVNHPYGRLLSPLACRLILWISEHYLSPMHKVIRLCIPERIWLGSFVAERRFVYHLARKVPEISPRAKGLLLLVGIMEKNNGRAEENVLLKVVSKAIVRKALEQGILTQEVFGIIPPTRFENTESESMQKRVLTVEQQHVFDEIVAKLTGKFLVHGVTGSGKTEIYLQIAEVLATQGKQTVMLVPEIALTPQLFSYFARVFGERVALFHSGLSAHERHTEWQRVREGSVDIILGSRSALFAPVPRMGALILDEEHEWTYKNEQNPKYHTRTVAEQMHKIATEAGVSFLLLLGSATPSIETMYRAREKGEYTLLELKKKIYEQEPGAVIPAPDPGSHE